eukprot:gnl/Spiro4/3889_TR1925_c0_g1_i1.p1 gnl/Spiro4/3889_TR1925_c0_g1~~gnl/Spiro4/3889_TR1925_c0_g1_i1.p1  ORF type:complete len:391 (-),score=75.79 gnl/Spiro4/3889_TR1925_c0_g1_i1:56-1135(-)
MESAHAAAMVPTTGAVPFDAIQVRGYDFSTGPVNYDALFNSLLSTGFQATQFGYAVREINRMLAWRLSDVPFSENEDEALRDIAVRRTIRCKIYLGYTSNMISCGVRETIRYLAQNKMVDVICTTTGGIEEDLMKCMGHTYIGSFTANGEALRAKGLNRIGNLLIANDNYCQLETWIMPILDQMLHEQKTDGVIWTPSKIIARLGKEIDHPESVYHWCYRNNIPVFCPALTDGSIGDMIFFHSYRNPGLIVDIAGDIRAINDSAMKARHTGMIILGGGVVKHHINNANLMRNGADHAILINTAQPFDGSDSGADPDEAVSWGKIKADAVPVKINGEASLIFPLLVSQTFAKPGNFEPKP